jgi:hypothetical protein
MTSTQQPPDERRPSVRISPKGSVVLCAGEHVERGRIASISGGGLLAITSGHAPGLSPGTPVAVELRLDAASSEWLRFAGHVLRIDGRSIGIALETGSKAFTRLVEDGLSASGADDGVRTVVLVDATPERRGPVADAFRACGCNVLEVATPLEAIVRLGELRFEPELIAIADSLPSAISDDLRIFVEREHPQAKLVTIGDDILSPRGSARWLSSADPHGDLLAGSARSWTADAASGAAAEPSLSAQLSPPSSSLAESRERSRHPTQNSSAVARDTSPHPTHAGS